MSCVWSCASRARLAPAPQSACPPPPPRAPPAQGLRKPAPASYEVVASTLARPPSSLIFVDDRAPNVDAAAALGWGALRFEGAGALEAQLRARGLEF